MFFVIEIIIEENLTNHQLDVRAASRGLYHDATEANQQLLEMLNHTTIAPIVSDGWYIFETIRKEKESLRRITRQVRIWDGRGPMFDKSFRLAS